MKIFQLSNRVLKKIQSEGVKNTLLAAVSNIYDRYYDLKFNIDTIAWVSNEELVKVDQVAIHASCYQATKVLPLRQLFKTLKLPKNQVIIDIGSGKGRVLFVASEFNFKTVRGIELSKSLCEIAQQNIINFTKKKKVNVQFEITNCDATSYQFKDDEYVFFLYNPFNEHVMSTVLDHINDSLKRNKRAIKIIYAYPVEAALIKTKLNVQKITQHYLWNGQFTVFDV